MKKIYKIIKLSEIALRHNEVPVGCIVLKNGKIIGKGYNKKQHSHKCTDHAEIIAICNAEKKIRDWRLDDCELYVTLEPCKMCMEVIKQSRIKKIYYIIPTNFDNEDKKTVNSEEIKCNQEIKENYQRKLQSFFKNKR